MAAPSVDLVIGQMLVPLFYRASITT